jgi:hypothetical protein
MHDTTGKRPRDVLLMGAIAIIFGFDEIYVGLFGNYLGILSHAIRPSVSTAAVGLFYSLGGFALFLTRRRWGTIASLVFIGAEVAGRAYLVGTGVASSTGPDFLKIIIGGAIAIALMAYIAFRSSWHN